jgi:hypothetical protein
MKHVKLILIFSILAGNFSCESLTEEDQTQDNADPLDLISSNLLKMGKIDPALLIGEWDCVKFAYTADGNEISDVKDISNLGQLAYGWYKIRIRDDDPTQYISDAPPGLFGPLSFGVQNLFYSISGGLMHFSRFSDYVFQILLPETEEVHDVLYALRNTYSFVIRNNELIIHFTGAENKNLLILKKR